MYRIAICDDDRNFIEKLQTLMLKHKRDQEDFKFYEFYAGEDFVDGLEEEYYDLVILDMMMKKLDGYETADFFRKYFPHTPLVFCSGICKPDVGAFRTMPFRYLLKSFEKEVLDSEMEEILNQMREKKEMPKILGKYYYSSMCFSPEDIMYFENTKKGSVLHVKRGTAGELEGKKITTDKKIDILERELYRFGFRMIHNRHLVNMYFVVKVLSDGKICLTDGTELKVSRANLEKIRIEFAKIMGSKYGGL